MSLEKLFSTFLLFILSSAAFAAGPKPEATQAWDRYIQLTEARVETQQRDGKNFLRAQPETAQQTAAFEAKLKGREIVVQKLTTTDQGKSIEAPGALIHDWVGTAFIHGASINQAFAVLQDYNHHSTTYAPEVQRSKLISRNGDDFTAYLRFVKKKVITVVLDTYHHAHYE